MTQAITSIMSYRQLTPKALGKKQNSVLAFIIKHQPVSNKQLSMLMQWPINTITPRVKELRELGLVEAAGYNLDHATNRMEILWKPVDLHKNQAVLVLEEL